jgi:hypothetical protein
VLKCVVADLVLQVMQVPTQREQFKFAQDHSFADVLDKAAAVLAHYVSVDVQSQQCYVGA